MFCFVLCEGVWFTNDSTASSSIPSVLSVQHRLKFSEYPSLAALIADFELLISNARLFFPVRQSSCLVRVDSVCRAWECVECSRQTWFKKDAL